MASAKRFFAASTAHVLVGLLAVLPAARLLGQPSAPLVPADQPVPRTDQNSSIAHAQLVDKARKGGIDVYFEGDSITRRWGATDYPALLANWKENFLGWNAADFGWGADTIQNIFWRVRITSATSLHRMAPTPRPPTSREVSKRSCSASSRRPPIRSSSSRRFS